MLSEVNPFTSVTMDYDLNDFVTCREPVAANFDPALGSNIIDAALPMPYWNNNTAPDIGAIEDGVAFPTTGTDWDTNVACP
jgi:hypothetical protein